MKLISLHLPESYLNILEKLVTKSRFPNRSEAIRVAIRDFIKTEYKIDEALKEKYDTDASDMVEPAISEKLEDDLVI